MTPALSASIRPARSADLAEIVRLLADDPLGRTRETDGADGMRAYRLAFEPIREDPRNLLVVAEEDGAIVGTLQLTFIPGLTFEGGERAQIEAVRVDRRRRGGGLGRAMLDWAIAWARERGCRLVQLTSNKQRADALRFYGSLGFQATHEGFKLAL